MPNTWTRTVVSTRYGDLDFGGSAAADEAAREDSWPKLLRFLDGPRAMALRDEVRVWTVRYRAHNGIARPAYVALPADIGPDHNPALPLVISPHGRGLTGRANLNFWSDLPARGRFAVISPEGHGRALPLHSWGWEGQIRDLANMQYVAKATLPWLRVRPHAVYAMGGSMGGQETLLLVARHNRLLKGAVSFDAPTDLARRYRDFPRIPNGRAPAGAGSARGRRLARAATPARTRAAARSPTPARSPSRAFHSSSTGARPTRSSSTRRTTRRGSRAASRSSTRKPR